MHRQLIMAAALALLLAPAARAAGLHACVLSPDRRTVTVTVSNPYAQETSCTVNCHLAIAGSGIASVSCTRQVPGGARQFVLCTRSRGDNKQYAKLADAGNSDCVRPPRPGNSDRGHGKSGEEREDRLKMR